MDKRFDQVLDVLGDIKREIGAPFEQFGRNVVVRILEGEGIKNVRLERTTLPDPDGTVFSTSKEVQIDGLSIDPPVIVEITSILKAKNKVTNFLKKKEFIERREGVTFRGFLVASSTTLPGEDIGDLVVLLRKNGCELINL